MVFRATLWAAHFARAVAFLLLIQPALEAGLVNPFRGAFATAGAHPLS